MQVCGLHNRLPPHFVIRKLTYSQSMYQKTGETSLQLRGKVSFTLYEISSE